MVDSILQVPGCSEIDVMAKVSSAATGGSWIVESNSDSNGGQSASDAE